MILVTTHLLKEIRHVGIPECPLLQFFFLNILRFLALSINDDFLSEISTCHVLDVSVLILYLSITY